MKEFAIALLARAYDEFPQATLIAVETDKKKDCVCLRLVVAGRMQEYTVTATNGEAWGDELAVIDILIPRIQRGL